MMFLEIIITRKRKLYQQRESLQQAVAQARKAHGATSHLQKRLEAVTAQILALGG